MKKIIAVLFALLVPAVVIAETIPQFQPGFRLIDGSQLNLLVDAINNSTVARGATTLDGSNPTAVSTGLTTIVACNVSLATSTAPGVSTSLVTGVISSSTLNIYGWKPTDATNNTLIASTGTDEVQWICSGTR